MLTLLKFEASWCKPCQNMKPIVEKLDADDDQLIVANIDIDDNPQERANYNVRSIPTFVLIKDGAEIGRKVGSGTLSEMKAFVDEHRGV